MKSISFAVLTLLAGCAGTPAVDPATHHTASTPGKDRNAMWQASLKRAPLAVTVAFDPRGRLWIARVEGGQLQLAISEDSGKTFIAPVTVNAEPERIAADGENRPKLAFGQNGEVYVSWTRSGEQPFSGDVRFARSLDDGKTFSQPVTVNDDRAPISHRFDALMVTPDGHIHVMWLDKRESAAAERRGEKYTGISLYHAISTDHGETFSANRKLADHTCECCRVALAADSDGTPVMFWRHVFEPNIRDHALLRLDGNSTPRRVSHDNWAIDACPHHGPALAISADGTYHMAWFNGAPGQSGLYYVHSRARGATPSTPMPFGAANTQAGRPAVAVNNLHVVLAWKEFDGQASVVRVMHSLDGGKSWSKPAGVARATSNSDHPQLLAYNGGALLAWNVSGDGLRLIPLSQLPALP